MPSKDMQTDELIEERPAPGVLVRHRGADLDLGPVARGSAPVELRRGAAWVRATPDGPGLVVTHGAATIEVRDGAAVVEVHDFEALVVVIAGRAAIKGAAALPRSVSAGQAVTLTLDGSFSDPEVLAAGELAADRMVVENLALDALGSGPAGPSATTAGTRAAERVVDGPPPKAPRPEPSALQTALAGVGVTGAEGEDAAADVPPGSADATAAGSEAAASSETDAEDPEPEGTSEDLHFSDEPLSSGARRLLVALIVVAIIAVAVVAALVLSGDESEGAQAADGSAVLLPAESTQATDVPATTDGAPDKVASEVEAEIDGCTFGPGGYAIEGTISGGGQLVSRYEVIVAVVDGDGEAYAETSERVVPSDDRARPAPFEASVPLAADEVRSGSDCEVIEAGALRIAPR